MTTKTKSAKVPAKTVRPNGVDQNMFSMVQTEESMLPEDLGIEEPDWREFLIDPRFDSPGVQHRKTQAFMKTFILWRIGAWTPPSKEDQPVESEFARRLKLARLTEQARD